MSPACVTRSLASAALRSGALRCAPLQRLAAPRAALAPRRAAGFRCAAAAQAAFTSVPKGANPSLVRSSAPPAPLQQPQSPAHVSPRCPALHAHARFALPCARSHMIS
jgi:hypothetical protein